MRYGVTLPSLPARTAADLAREAEAAGWDGVFVWDTIFGPNAWIVLAAIATATERLRLGTMLTPLSRRRPWTVANEAATLDHLSIGRLILPVGLGAASPEHIHNDFVKVGEETDRRTRAALLDESLDILDGLWSGQPFAYEGQHYHLRDIEAGPRPFQQPRVPIWVVAAWPRMKSMRRALRCDGVLPTKMNAGGSFAEMTPDDLREMRVYIAANRMLATPFDIVMEEETPGDDPARAAQIVGPLAEAGVTWWLEAVWKTPETLGGVEGMRARIRQGPPRV
jgi:alkanesulfonate monooxygenase SsuD/methylene tetrahydromethanopterin reductase-like flavin-dependent oxidoreductase (luciferase family)